MGERKTLESINFESGVLAEYLTPAEAADLLPAVSRRTVQDWAKKGKLPNSLKLPSGQWRISRFDIESIYNGRVA